MNFIISALIDKRALSDDNIITATYTTKDVFGRLLTKTDEFSIVMVHRIEDQIKFTLKHLVDKIQISIDDEQIIAIDGMNIRRYADVYDINCDGSDKKTGKKRGRKPKLR